MGLFSNAQLRRVAQDGITSIAVMAATYYVTRLALSYMDPNHQKKSDAKKVSDTKLGKLGINRKEVKLNEYEEQIAMELILPDDIPVTFESIGGLDGIIASLQESVIAPLIFPEIFSTTNGLLGAPKGVLLYGPPGTGKTMLAKALAKESGATFINMHVSTLTNKWFGESNKLVAALFGLARKLQPTIVFIDEIDSFLRERSSGDHEAMAMMKAEFMTLWDGLTSSTDRILVLGATNRPSDIDAAILRRMPKRYAVSLPDAGQRKKILSIMLANVPCHSSFDMDEIVRKTVSYSGSDLKELCRNAAMVPVREVLRSRTGREKVEQARQSSKAGNTVDGSSLAMTVRPLKNSDFFQMDVAHATPTEPDALD
ncbi:Similar to S.cerevisiae protein MSP1 (Highly-conserved N-terminally anchored AAA-ATPase) [Malassezia sympodialis ATCC 42132]|uniref:Similar to S.cerevisiae protein MSP1 (Highly-conserved N-terminally anchored AAA-ATPase) n=2 Tax=Malassezia sympodialis (strain ATCC 42132) TaxID=1230383 RepID=A0A1M8A2X6_MALS4|nr:Similar to S.cerevisiae protein MSP1 (Highly-conserved N-terminally anchored AAA-ATPase) [Malassezia sympodialis ATCC 42132]